MVLHWDWKMSQFAMRWLETVCPSIIIKWNGKEATVQRKIEVLRTSWCLLSARHVGKQRSVRLAIKIIFNWKSFPTKIYLIQALRVISIRKRIIAVTAHVIDYTIERMCKRAIRCLLAKRRPSINSNSMFKRNASFLKFLILWFDSM